MRHHNARGISVVMALLAMLFLGGVAATTLSLVSTSQEQRGSETAAQQAAGLAQAGIEYAKNRIDQGTSPIVADYPLGAGTFSISADPNTGRLTIVGQAGNARRTATLTTPFAKQCIDLDVSHAHSAAKNIVGMKLRKTCLTKATITDWQFSWQPNAQEKTVKLQVQGDQLATLFDYPQGYPSGQQIDAQDFTLTKNNVPYPINKLEFARTLLAGKTYTITLLLSDTSTFTKTFTDPGSAPNEIPPPPPGGTGIDVKPDGTVAIAPNKIVAVDALCAEITMNAGGQKIPVTAALTTTVAGAANTQPLFNGQAVQGGEHAVVNSGGQGAAYAVTGTAALGNFRATYTSTNKKQVKVLTNGAAPPPLAGFGGQKAVAACVKPFLNQATGKVVLNPNQVLYLFELGVDVAGNPNNPAADFQDLVVVLTVD